MMGDPFQKLHNVPARRQYNMREISHHQRPTTAMEYSHYKWDSPWPNPQRRHQELILLNRTGSSWTPDQPPVTLEKIVLSKISNPVMQERNSGHTQMMDTKTITTPQISKCFTLWSFLNEQSLVNILYFAAVTSKFRITIDTELELFINIHLHNGTRIIFKQCGAGLSYFDTRNEVFPEDQTKEYTFLNTVDSTKSCFNRRETKGANEARILKQLVGWPYTKILK